MTDGVQYLSVTATAGPSGVAGISCSLDSAPSQWHAGTSASIPVQGLGDHSLSCSTADNAHDSAGNAGWSAPATWNLSIREPTVTRVSFVRIAGALRCARAHEHIHVPAQYVWARAHGRRVRVRIPAQTRTVTRVRCHPRYVRRRVRVRGHLRVVRIPELPRTVRWQSSRPPRPGGIDADRPERERDLPDGPTPLAPRPPFDGFTANKPGHGLAPLGEPDGPARPRGGRDPGQRVAAKAMARRVPTPKSKQIVPASDSQRRFPGAALLRAARLFQAESSHGGERNRVTACVRKQTRAAASRTPSRCPSAWIAAARHDAFRRSLIEPSGRWRQPLTTYSVPM
jgi:hypothetical protein